MKSIACLIWVLVTLVAAAAVDRVPDPPAASPDLTQFRISCTHELPLYPSSPALLFVPSLARPEGSAALHFAESVAPANRIDPLARGTDPSPPRLA